MKKPRDVRRFGSGPYLLGLTGGEGDPDDHVGFPYEALADVQQLSFDQPVTLLAGDNGTGKSTIIEACAAAMGFAEEGGELERLGELPAVPRSIYKGFLTPVVNRWARPRIGYFLRARELLQRGRVGDQDDGSRPTCR